MNRQTNAIGNNESLDKVSGILAHARAKGVRLWSENGQLRYRAPRGALTQEEMEALRVFREEIVAILEGADAPGRSLRPGLRPGANRAPMTFSQLAHWNLYRLHERPALRRIASATRLRGRLNLDALRSSITEIQRRHEALRTTIVVVDGVPMQQIASSISSELKVSDLTSLQEADREAAVDRAVEELRLVPIHLDVGPLFEVRLARLRQDEHVLIAVMEHSISDARSMEILLRDLFAAYRSLSGGHGCALPDLPLQFSDYAIWQSNAHAAWMARHAAYWDEQLSGCRRLRFPQGEGCLIENPNGWGTAPVRIEKDLKARLLDWSKIRRTTLVMSVFTAYVGLVLRWCDATDAVMRYQTDGRTNSKVENAIGYFASVLHLRIELRDDDSFLDLLNRVTDLYCQAHEHDDSSYLDAQVPQPEFARNTSFNWVPRRPRCEWIELAGSQDEMRLSPVPVGNPVLANYEKDGEPVMLLYDDEDEAAGGVYFPLDRFSRDTMERFTRNFLVFLESMLKQPQRRVRDIALCA